MFDFLPELMKYIMRLCDWASLGYYAVSLFLFALCIKILLFPLSIKTQKNQVKSAKLRPKEMAIRRKYQGRNDQATQQKMAAELQEMYRAEGHNQFGGCLPMFIQLPILFALYEIIRNPLYYVCDFTKAQVELITDAYQKLVGYQDVASLPSMRASAFLAKSEENVQKIIDHLPVDGSVPEKAGEFADYAAFRADLVNDLTTADYPNFTFLGIDLSVLPNEKIFWYVLIPVAVFLVYFFTMKLQKKFTYQVPAADAQTGMSMKIMDFSMPALSAVFAFSLPTGLGFYWMYQSVLGLLQQMILSKMYPLPKYTDEEIRMMEREAEKAAKEARKAEAEERKKIKAQRETEDSEEDDIPRRKPMTAEEEAEMLKRFKASTEAADKKKNKPKKKD